MIRSATVAAIACAIWRSSPSNASLAIAASMGSRMLPSSADGGRLAESLREVDHHGAAGLVVVDDLEVHHDGGRSVVGATARSTTTPSPVLPIGFAGRGVGSVRREAQHVGQRLRMHDRQPARAAGEGHEQRSQPVLRLGDDLRRFDHHHAIELQALDLVGAQHHHR